MKFGFIAKHRGIWPVLWMCEALGVSRGGFYAWLTRPRSQRSRDDEELGAKVRASFLGSDRTYGARRVWKGPFNRRCVLRLASDRAIDAAAGPQSTSTPRRLPPDLGSGRRPPSHPTYWIAPLKPPLPTANGSLTSPMSGPRRAGSMSRPSSICSPAVWSAGR